jgi:cellulose biosynthesis protein BcsQ
VSYPNHQAHKAYKRGIKRMSTAAVVLSGKGGTAKTLWQLTMAGEASRAGINTLLVDVDPERNLSNRFGISQHASGLGNVLRAAGAGTGETDPVAGSARLLTEIVPAQASVNTPWPHVDLLPAGADLVGLSQVTIEDGWLLRDIFEAAGIADRYEVVLLDTGGRRGSLVTLAMYAADVAYAPVAPTMDAVRKALEARSRVHTVQRSHPGLRWAGIVLSGFDQRVGIDEAIRGETAERFGSEVRAEVPRRAAVHEAFQLCERLGDRPDVSSAALAKLFSDFLRDELMTSTGVTA